MVGHAGLSTEAEKAVSYGLTRKVQETRSAKSRSIRPLDSRHEYDRLYKVLDKKFHMHCDRLPILRLKGRTARYSSVHHRLVFESRGVSKRNVPAPAKKRPHARV